MVGIDSTLNELEQRVAQLEQKTVQSVAGHTPVDYDNQDGTTTINDQVDWTSTDGWEPYSTIAPIITDPTATGYPGGQLSTPYARPEAHLVGRMCLLTGMVRRQAGALNLTAGTRYESEIFGLPADWRPVNTTILPCLMGNADPTTGTPVVFGTALVEIRSGYVDNRSGRAFYIAGTTGCDANIGWIALQGIIPIQIIQTEQDANEMDSWGTAHFQLTWGDLTTEKPAGQWDHYSQQTV